MKVAVEKLESLILETIKDFDKLIAVNNFFWTYYY